MISPCEEMVRRDPSTPGNLTPECLDYFIRKAHRLRSEAIFARLTRALRYIWRH